MASLSRSARLFAAALCITVVAAPMPAAWAHEDDQPSTRSAEASKITAPVAGAACKKAGTKSCWDKPGAGIGETELNRLFYRLGWTKGWYKGDLRNKVFGQLDNETTKPAWKTIKTKLTEMARKYDRAA